MTQGATTTAPDADPIRPLNALWAALALALMAGVIVSGNLLALNFLHVMSAVLWTGIDLFMGFVVGPVLRAAPFEARRAVMLRLTPKTMFLLPTLAILTGASGWHLAAQLGYLELPWPQFGWVAAALALITALTVQGLGLLLPTQIRVYLELRKPQPDVPRIIGLTKNYFWLVAVQGSMQVAMVLVMAKFRTGL
ncbi:MAG: hypothetical protein JWN93_2937 [Hyphomicrobiales bacterium]|nr:hypothetical protein [Hyphomicrobiales bacterium]